MLPRFRFFAAILFAAASCLATTNHANSATVTVGLISKQIAPNDPAGEWELWAWTSSGDNDGIESVTIEFFGNDVRGRNQTPIGFSSGTVVQGFLNSSTSFIPNDETGNILHASHERLVPSSYVYGVGSPDIPERINTPQIFQGLGYRQWDWWVNPAFISSQSIPGESVEGTNPFDVPLGSVLIANGTTASYKTVHVRNFSSVFNITVWAPGEAAINGNVALVADTIVLRDHLAAVPEPSALFLAGILGILTVLAKTI